MKPSNIIRSPSGSLNSEGLRFLETVTVSAPDIPPGRKAAILAAIRDEQAPDQTRTRADRVLSIADAADALHVTPRTVFRLCAEGGLERVRLPGRTRGLGVLESSLRNLLARNAPGGAS